MPKIIQKLASASSLGRIVLGLLAAAVLLAMACIQTQTSLGFTNTQIGAGQATNTSPLGQRIKFGHISLEQGLSQSSVYCIAQDSQGFMWFGTQDGLNKYDGYNFQVYKHDPDDPYSLSDNTVRSIFKDSAGVLWIGTDGGGLDRFDRNTERFSHFQHDSRDLYSLSNNDVLVIYEDSTGMLWIGTDGGGLDRLDRTTESFFHYQKSENPHSLSDDHVFAIYEDESGVLWIGTADGLNRFDREIEQFTHYRNDPDDVHSLSHNTIVSIHPGRQSILWIATLGGGLDRFDLETERFVHYQHDSSDPRSLSDNVVWTVFTDHEGALWVGTYEGGLDRFDPENEQFTHYRHNPNDSSSLSNDMVRSLYRDKSGVLWIGTNGGGLNKLDAWKKGFAHYQNDPNDSNSLSNNHVLSLYQDKAELLWIGTSGNGLDKLDWETGRFVHYRNNPGDSNSLSDDFVSSILQDQEGLLWIGTHGSGLDRLVLSHSLSLGDASQSRVEGLERETGRFIHYQNNRDDPHSLSNDEVSVIYADRSGALWIGTLGGGLNRFDRETERFVHYRHKHDDANSLSNDYVRAIYQDQVGALWIGTDDGLNKLDPDTGQFTRYRNDPDDPHSLGDNFVLAIYQDQSGALWVGTNGSGLDEFDLETETFVHYRERDGLPNNVVYGILGDAEGFIWLSTNKGLSKFDPRTEIFRNYDTSDGLQSNEFNVGAFHKSSDGEMFFGGINGFNAFYPQSIQDNPYVPPVVLTSLTQSGQEVITDVALEDVKQVTFRWPNNFFEFEFAALGYSQAEKNQYAYMLEGFDKDWIYIGTRRFGRYTNVPGGTYTLRIKGSNNDGVWNERGVSIKVIVVPPLWETRWLQGLVALLVLGGGIGGYWLRVRNIHARTRELENQVEERTHALEHRTREAEQRRQELEALYRADAELHRHLSLDEVLQALVDIAVDLLRADKSALMVWDEEREQLVVRVARGFKSETLAQMSFALDQGTVGRVAASSELIIVRDAHLDPRVARRRSITDAEGIRSFMQVPIKIAGEVFGVFSADYVQSHAFGDDERRLFIALAQRAALAIDTAQLYEQTQELAVVEERNRLARDLHDAVTQTLFSASLIAEVLPTLWESDQDEGRQLLKELRQLSRGALAEMRTLLLELRPAALAETGLSDLLRQLAEAATGREGMPVTVTIEGQCTLPPDVHVALYRIAQEALNNVVKHAQASQVTVSLRYAPLAEGQGRRVELRVSDDGCGFDPSCVLPDRLGLGIIRERAQAIGAALEIESKPGHGTQVIVLWTDDEGRRTNRGTDAFQV